MRVSWFLASTALLLLVGCGPEHSADHGHDHAQDEAVEKESGHESHADSDDHDHGAGHDHDGDDAVVSVEDHGLQTHDGEKWPMDDHTRSMFTTMSERLESFEGDPQALGVSLEDDLSKLIEGCTMTGDAHNELHKFLAVYLPAVGSLADAGQDADLERVKELLDLYPSYFE